MQKKTEEHIFQGMQRDMAVSKQKPEYLWDANNIRLTSRHGETLLSMTNERGTKKYGTVSLQGIVLGYCVLGNYLTVFTKNPSAETKQDFIYRIERRSKNIFKTDILYNGNLNFNVNKPIECLGVYENLEIQKVYWTDGQNQPRFINIKKKDNVPQDQADSIYNDTSFDFIPTLSLKDKITVKKVADSSGLFPAGVVQYAVTYYNKYGQESNISVVSPLIATSYTQRAGSTEETIGNAFKVTVENPDTQFEFMRVYSIFRSSKNTTPVCKRVADVRLGYGGNTSSKLYISNDAKDVAYSRVSNNSVTFKDSYDGNFQNLLDNQSYRGTETITVSGVTFTANHYYHFNKETCPELIIKANEHINSINNVNMTSTYFTWGSCTDIYISTERVSGPGSNNYRLILAGGSNPFMKAASDIHYGYDSFLDDGKITITDNNTNGEEIDYNELLFVGGEEITAGTLTQKDGTMFLGDITVSRPNITGSYDNAANNESNDVQTIKNAVVPNIHSSHRICCFPVTMNSASYKWGNTLDAHFCNAETYTENNEEKTRYIDTGISTNIAGFKSGEHYRLGLQFQYKTGKWSQPVFIGDATESENPSLNITDNLCVQNVPTFTAIIPAAIGNMMINKNYQRVRPVVCFPTESDQLILCQGLLNPTVHSVAGRLNHTPDVQSSWFFRPVPDIEPTVPEQITYEYNGDTVTNDISNPGAGIPQYKNGYTLYSGTVSTRGLYEYPAPTRHDEIQNVPVEFSNKQISELLEDLPDIDLNFTVSENPQDTHLVTSSDKYEVEDLTNIFVVDWQYLTFHSPEFEFKDSFRNIDTTTLKCKVIGKYLVSANQGDIHIMTSSSPIASDAQGFCHRQISTVNASRITAGLFYKDSRVNYDGQDYVTWSYNNDNNGLYFIDSFLIYPWHRTGSLNNDCIRPYGDSNSSRTAVLRQKKLSNLMYFQHVTRENDIELKNENNNADIKIFNSDQVSLVKINDYNYFGNIDQVLSSRFGYKIGLQYYNDQNIGLQYIQTTGNWDIGTAKSKGLYVSNDPVYMKYKSTPHAVIHTTTEPDDNSVIGYSTKTGFTYIDNTWPYLHRAEIYRGSLPTDFGGTSAMAIHNNLWYPAGPAIEMIVDENTTVEYMYGDTYYQRYDCLKTYPFTDEDTNSIIEIGSFMVETRVNIDGRYDKNRGNTTNFMLNPTNFNLINLVYSQLDNFFNYRILDEDYYALTQYPTMVTWTGYKNNAAEVDNWTNITLASTLEMDGTKGKVNAVRVNSDQLYCFQNDAVGQILFNSRVQISPSDGVPIEISNNYKVDGNRYISTSIGCQNKWSIAEGIDGLYFIDNNTKALYMLGGQAQLKPISTPLNMSYWFMKQDCATSWIQHYWQLNEITDEETDETTYTSWETQQKGIRCFYDNANADLYICTPETTLCYSEKLGQFVSFFDYHNVMGMFNIDSDYYALNYTSGDYYDDSEIPPVNLWGMFQGVYNTFFDKMYPTDFTFISNENPLNDKIFTNIELRGDFRLWYKNQPEDNFYSENHAVDHRKMFDTIRVWNEYQDTDTVDLDFTDDIPSNMKKKFRIWRMDIPRDSINPGQRIRNTWAKIKFTMNTLPEVDLEDLIGKETDFIIWDNGTETTLNFINTSTVTFTYENNCIVEKRARIHNEIQEDFTEYARYYINGTVISRKLYTESTMTPYAYRKIHDMEIHDIGVVYFV